MKYNNESQMPGPGDEITWGPCTGHPLDPRTPPDPEDEPEQFDDPYIYGGQNDTLKR